MAFDIRCAQMRGNVGNEDDATVGSHAGVTESKCPWAGLHTPQATSVLSLPGEGPATLSMHASECESVLWSTLWLCGSGAVRCAYGMACGLSESRLLVEPRTCAAAGSHSGSPQASPISITTACMCVCSCVRRVVLGVS